MTLYLNFLNSFIEFILFSFFSLPLDIGHYRRQRRQVVRSPDWYFHRTGLVKIVWTLKFQASRFLVEKAEKGIEKSPRVRYPLNSDFPSSIFIWSYGVKYQFRLFSILKPHLLNNSLFNNFFRKFSPSPDFSLSCIL